MNSDEKRDEAVTLGNLSYHLQVRGSGTGASEITSPGRTG